MERLADVFPGSTQTLRVGLDRASDEAVWDHAVRHDYAIVMRDVDLADMAALRGPPPLVVWLRIGNSSTTAAEAALRVKHREIMEAETNGAACVEIW